MKIQFAAIKLFLILNVLWTLAESQTVADVKDVITQLFTTDSYNKRVRPVDDQLDPVHVSMDFYLVGIDEFDEVTQKLTTTGYLYIFWTDTELQWDPTTFGEVSRIQVPQNEIWKPDITLQNGKTDMKELGGSYLLITVHYDGSAEWSPYHNFQTKCSVDVSYFPFDEQTCEIKFVAWSSSIDDILIDHGDLGIILEEYEENGEWEILRTNSSHSKTRYEATVIYTLYLKRRPAFMVLNIIVPILLLGFLDLFVFILPADSGEKVGFSVTVLLAFAVFLTIVSDSLPKNSIKTPILSIYLIIQLTVSALCVLLTMFQLRLFHRDEDRNVPAWLQKFVRLIWKIQCTGRRASCICCCRGNIHVEDLRFDGQTDWKKPNLAEKPIKFLSESDKEENSSRESDINWKSVTNAFDYIFFWILFILQLAAGATFFLITGLKLNY